MTDQAQHMVLSMSRVGLRITEQRKSIITLFVQADGYLTPRAVYESLATKHSGLSYDTVYRNLRIMSEVGILEPFHFDEGVKFRIGCYADHDHHHHHLICVSCDHIFPLDDCPMDKGMKFPSSFRVTGHRFEVYGYCTNCDPLSKKSE